MDILRAKFNSPQHEAAKELRAEVLRKPLGLSPDDPAFNDVETDVHLVALKNEEVVGVVVLVPDYKLDTGKLRQMATSEKVRGEGYGVKLVNELERQAKSIGLSKIILHARHYAVGFYEKLGYTVTSEVFQEVGMDHYVMEKTI